MEEHFCKLHNCKFYRNEKDGKFWYSHKKADGTGYCNEPKEQPQHQEITREPVEKPDWDAIAEGKIRSLFIEANISKNGMVRLTEGELIVLDELVGIAMGKK